MLKTILTVILVVATLSAALPSLEFKPAGDIAIARAASGWLVELVKTHGGSSPPALVLDSENRPHVLACPPGEAWYAIRDKTGWTFELIARTVAGGVCGRLALGPDGKPHVMVPPRTGDPGTMYAVKDNGTWSFRPAPYPVGDMEVDSAGTVHIASTRDFANGTQLRYARLVGDSWHTEYVDFLVRYTGYAHWTDMVLDNNDTPHILYYSAGTDQVRYAYRLDDGNWHVEVVESVGNIGYVGRHGSMMVDGNGIAHATYLSSVSWKENRATLRHSIRNSSGWSIETVDGPPGMKGFFPTMLLSPEGLARIGFQNWGQVGADLDLRYATYNGSAWNFETVYDAPLLGVQFPDFAMDSCGNPHAAFYSNDDAGVMYATKGNCTSNRPPIVTANGPYSGHEGTPLTLTATATDPDDDPLTYRWDLDDDGIADTSWSPSPAITHTWPDDYTGTVRVEVSDGKTTANATATVTILNLPPSIDGLACTIERRTAEAWLRIAGEKWHDVSATLYRKGTEAGNATIVRRPGSPNDQEAHLGTIDTTATYDATVLYTPDDDPVNGKTNGATPAWIILRKDDGSEERLHHTFNVRHLDTWIWTVMGLEDRLAAREVTCTATATDPGMDDLSFTWDWGDGSTATVSSYLNGGGFPFTAMDMQTHTYSMAGVYDVRVRVTDDDGGAQESTVSVIIP